MRTYHECVGGIETTGPRITVWHHEACRVMTNRDCEGQIFLSHPQTNNGFRFLLTIKYCIIVWFFFEKKRLLDFLDYAEMRHNMMTSLQHYNDAIYYMPLFVTGWRRVIEIEFSHMGKNSGNPYLVCKKHI